MNRPQPIEPLTGPGATRPSPESGRGTATTDPSTVIIVIHPRGRGRYAAMADDRERCVSQTPFFDAARRLLNLGYPPDAKLAMRHTGSPIVAMRATIGEAAKLMIEEGRNGPAFRAWRPFDVERVETPGRLAQDGDSRPAWGEIPPGQCAGFLAATGLREAAQLHDLRATQASIRRSVR